MNQPALNQSHRVLIIDDNPAIHDDFRKILVPEQDRQELTEAAAAFFGDEEASAAHHQVRIELDSAMQGEEGYKKVVAAQENQRPYALAFCDMRMPPGWDGLTTIEKLWEADPDLQIVICSAYSDKTWIDISQRLGSCDRLLILKKPFDNAEVMQLVVALIEKRRLIERATVKREQLESLIEERTAHLNDARRESERLLVAIDSLLIGVDEQGAVQRWNQSAVDIFGLTSKETMGLPLNKLPIQWEDPRFVESLVREHDQESSTRMETSFADSTGEQRVIGFSCYPVRDEGVHRGTLILGTDLTENRLMEQQLQQAQKLESIGQLAAGVAHEINTPMQYLGDNLEFLKSKTGSLLPHLQQLSQLLEAAGESDFQPELVEDLQQQQKKLKLDKLCHQLPEALSDSIEGVEHVSRIVRAMKELSHPGGEECAPVDLNKVLETAITVSTNEWKYVADIKTDLDSELDFVAGFAGELNQVFLNLIINASHAISELTDGGNQGRGNIHLSTRRQNEFVRIEITDSGGGIPASIRNRVFDPFFTTKAVGKGTGQGLAFAHSTIVQKHKGKLWFEVDEGVGTTFFIEIPLAANGNSGAEQSELVSTI